MSRISGSRVGPTTSWPLPARRQVVDLPLGRDERGRLRFVDGETSIANRDDARTELFAKMEKALATGDKVFPQGD
jgi:hypothetical protein